MADETSSGMSGPGATGPGSQGQNQDAFPTTEWKGGPGGPDYTKVLNATVAQLVDVTKVELTISDLAEDIKKKLEELPAAVREVTDQLKKMHLGVKAAADEIEGTVDSYEKLRKKTRAYNEELGRGQRSVEENIDLIKELIKDHEDLLKTAKLESRERDKLKLELRNLISIHGELTKQIGKTLDVKPLQKYRTEIDKVTTAIKAWGLEFKKIEPKFTAHGKRAENIRAAISDSGFYMKPSLRARLQKFGQLAANMRTIQEGKAAGKKERADKFVEGTGLFGKRAKLDRFRRADGSVDWDAAARADKKPLKYWENFNADKQAPGMGWLGKRAMSKFAEAKAGGEPLSWMNKAILSNAERGGGLRGVMSGVGSWGMGIAEGGMERGAAALAVPVVGEIIMVLDLLRRGFDKQIEINQGIEKNLGTAGVLGTGGYGNGRSVFENLSNVQGNLMPSFGGGFYSNLGITYKRNMEIATAMQQAGVGLGELQRPSSVFKTSPYGPGGYGAIQQTAYTTARMAGFDTAAGTAMAIKLVQTYTQSLDSTHDFFITLNKDAKAAGMTTTKYVGIIDDVTSGLDRMNKSFATAVTTLHVLGQSGTQTAEDMKDLMSAMTGGGNRTPLAMSAYLSNRMMANTTPAERTAQLGQLTAETTDAATEMARMLTEAKTEKGRTAAAAVGLGGMQKQEIVDWLKQATPQQLSVMNANLQGFQPAAGGIASTQMQGALNRLTTAQMQEAALRDRQQGRINDLQLATSQQFGMNLANRQIQQSTKVMNAGIAAGGPNWMQSFLDNSLMRNPLFLQMLEQEGVKPEDVMRIRSAYGIGAGLAAKQIIAGGPAADRYAQRLSERGLFTGTGADLTAMGRKDQSSLESLLLKSGDINNAIWQQDKNVVKPAERIAAEQQAEQLTVATRPTADLFADAFEHLFMLIVRPINTMLDLFRTFLGPLSDIGKPSTEQLNQIGDTQDLLSKANTNIDRLIEQARAKPGGTAEMERLQEIKTSINTITPESTASEIEKGVRGRRAFGRELETDDKGELVVPRGWMGAPHSDRVKRDTVGAIREGVTEGNKQYQQMAENQGFDWGHVGDTIDRIIDGTMAKWGDKQQEQPTATTAASASYVNTFISHSPWFTWLTTMAPNVQQGDEASNAPKPGKHKGLA